MKSKRRIINMLRNPDEKTLEILSAEYPQAEQNNKDKMYEKVKERMNSNNTVFSDEVSGVEKYTRRHLWKMVPAAMVSIVLLGGAVGGGVMLLKNNSNNIPSTEIAEETTTSNVITDETDAEHGSAQSDVTKDMIFEICENGNTKNFDKISYSYELRSDYDTGYHDEEKADIYVDNNQNTAIEVSIGGYYNSEGDVVHKNNYTQYFCNNTLAVFNEPDINDTDNNQKEFYSHENDTLDYIINGVSLEGKNLLENFDNWNIIGVEEYLGRKCAVIGGTSDIKMNFESLPDQEENFEMCTCDFTITIDIETGIWMKSDIKHTNYDLAHYTFTITDICYGDDAKAPISKDEFKQSALNGCVKRVCDESGQNCTFEPVNESDLDFLD